MTSKTQITRLLRDWEDGEGGTETNPRSRLERLAIDRAIEVLAERDACKADILVLTCFGGVSCREIASTTVSHDLRFSRAWIGQRLSARGENSLISP